MSEDRFWERPEWRAEMMASLTARGISARRADELIERACRRYEEEERRDQAWEAEK